MANYVSDQNATALMTAIAAKFREIGSAYKDRGSRTFAELPSELTASMLGFVYNVTDGFTTDSRFREGAGKTYPAGTNVVVIDDGDSTTPAYKFDVIGSFIDTSALEAKIQDVSDMISSEFSAEATYNVGDVVVYEGDLYKCTTAHTGAWSANDFTATTVASLIAQAEPAALTTAQVNALIALL